VGARDVRFFEHGRAVTNREERRIVPAGHGARFSASRKASFTNLRSSAASSKLRFVMVITGS
jgi:hypothetical protein